ncbi:hypothetical protein E2C01_066198 [Portunus trituberculatus]|uniref:Uncharacterized protein n=1 Tax=Portunus trituberculatus TaxID=210409 RepID=A0A5B7HPM3_PORTR|nr:hypothetical protein [Portunus trituberculatus]
MPMYTSMESGRARATKQAAVSTYSNTTEKYDIRLDLSGPRRSPGAEIRSIEVIEEEASVRDQVIRGIFLI